MKRRLSVYARFFTAANMGVAGSVWAPRTGAKLKAILIPPRRDEGASGPQIVEATGWAPHTVRGFLAGLAKKGIEVDILERVRQVGPNNAGAKGSYTVYRLADVPQP